MSINLREGDNDRLLMVSINCISLVVSLEDLYYKRIDRKHATLSHNYTHTKKKK